MKMIQRGGWAIAIITCIAFTGCGSKVRYEKTEEIDNQIKAYEVPGPTKDQKVKIEVSADSPVIVLVQFVDKQGSKEYIAKPEENKEITLEVDIPAGKAFVVMVETKKKTMVTTKINSL